MLPKIIFTKLEKTQFPPQKPLVAWDGNCGFCHYWVLRWKTITGDKVEFQPFQSVAKDFPDIEYRYFKQALRMIDVDGKIYGGPAAAFRAFEYGNKHRWIMSIYSRFKLIEWVTDHFYSFVSRHRTFMYKVTVRLWGRNPIRQKNYWAYYLGGLTALIVGLVFYLK
jgi:predicted DCC family thiol-disulfide oxidoreductase YuxK